MKRCLTMLLFLIAVSQSPAVEPKPVPPAPAAIKAKVTPSAPKAGDILVIDASIAQGNVKFKHDFPSGSYILEGKKLYIAVPAAEKTWQIYIVYFKEEADETVTIGAEKPVPDQKQDTLKQLRADMMSIFAKIDERLTAIEQQKPPPVVDAFQMAVQAAYEHDGSPLDKAVSLAAIYRNSGPIVNNSANTKYKDILTVMHNAAQTRIGDSLPTVRRVLADEFNVSIGGKTGTALDANGRKIIAAEFLKAQKALEGLK